MSEPEEVSRDELIVVVRRQAGQLAVQDRQISEMAGELAQLMEANEALAGKLAKLEHLLSHKLGQLLESAVEGRRSGQARTAGAQQARPGWAEAAPRQAARGAGVASGVDG